MKKYYFVTQQLIDLFKKYKKYQIKSLYYKFYSFIIIFKIKSKFK